MEININEIFDVVIEPEHSLMVLQEFETKYGYNSKEIYKLHKKGLIDNIGLDISKKELNSWIHHFIIFKENS